MRINEIIKEKRNEQGLTQEQVAEYLGVSTPAVNKWEKGNSYPDITLLAPLARLLKVDLNTLLSFNEELTEKEIIDFVNELSEIVYKKGFDIGFKKAMDKIHKYPTCHKLILNVAIILQSANLMWNKDNKEDYEIYIDKLFEEVIDSEDFEVRNQAISMTMYRYLDRKEYDKAQNCIDRLPNITYDKEILQGSLYRNCGEVDKASEVFEKKLLSDVNKIFSVLLSMMSIALDQGRNEDAKYLAEVLEKTTELYDLWEYNSYTGYFQLYTKQKDVNNSIDILKKMLPTMNKKWDMSKSRLYNHIKVNNEAGDMNKKFLKTFVDALKNDESDEFSFLKDNEEFINLLEEY